jgi:hypothetical protein
MKHMLIGSFVGMALTCGCLGQAVVPGRPVVAPATPKDFTKRSLGTNISSDPVVIQREEAKPGKKRYSTHIALTDTRIWHSRDDKSLQGKLIAFEDLVVETPQDAPEPTMPPPPAKPTVIRDGKARLFINQKCYEIDLTRLIQADQDLIRKIQSSFEKTGKKTPAP